MGKKIAAMVVWYNPDAEIKKNIKSYINEVDKLYIIDNSFNNNYMLLENEDSKIVYLPQYKNLGISKALNIGCELAIQEGFDWILTMDQDSVFCENSFFKIKKFLEDNNNENVGIICPRYHYIHEKLKGESKKNIELKKVITSGNLLSLNAYKNVGKFNENFFIDQVDFEYCMRLIKKNYKIVQESNSILLHSLGNSKKINIFNLFEIDTSNHSPARRYYMTRNTMYMTKMHPEIKIKYILSLILEMIKIIFFEKEKISKLYYMYCGVIDYVRKKVGEK